MGGVATTGPVAPPVTRAFPLGSSVDFASHRPVTNDELSQKPTRLNGLEVTGEPFAAEATSMKPVPPPKTDTFVIVATPLEPVVAPPPLTKAPHGFATVFNTM